MNGAERVCGRRVGGRPCVGDSVRRTHPVTACVRIRACWAELGGIERANKENYRYIFELYISSANLLVSCAEKFFSALSGEKNLSHLTRRNAQGARR